MTTEEPLKNFLNGFKSFRLTFLAISYKVDGWWYVGKEALRESWLDCTVWGGCLGSGVTDEVCASPAVGACLDLVGGGRAARQTTAGKGVAVRLPWKK